jgi:NAD(P)-dependent dehydrogenase (short-subunit alcohol dehydrogenase family)
MKPALTATFAALLLGAALLSSTPATAADEPGTALITGANRGIGLALARRYAQAGWKVIATARNPAEAADLQALAASDPDVTVEALDVTNFASVDALAAKYAGKPIDLLVNNAGITGDPRRQTLGNVDYDMGRKVYETNVIGPLKMTDAFIGNVQASRLKKVVTISSSEGSMGMARGMGRMYFYRSSKSAVNMVMLNIAMEQKPKGVIVAVINPGAVDTDMMKGVRMPLQPVNEAAAKVAGVIDRLTLEDAGKFWDYQGGTIPW